MTGNPPKTWHRPPILAAGSALAAASMALATLATHTPAWLLWNASPSVPEGLYLVSAAGRLRPGDMIVTTLPPEVRTLAAERRYLPADVPLIKPVAGLPGQTVCRSGAVVSIDGKPLAMALTRDRQRRTLPTWIGCRKILSDEVFLMNPAVPDSFDGRYFGPIDRRLIIGRATALYTSNANSRR